MTNDPEPKKPPQPPPQPPPEPEYWPPRQPPRDGDEIHKHDVPIPVVIVE